MFVFINNFEVLNHAEKKKEGWFLTVSDFAWSLQTLTLKYIASILFNIFIFETPMSKTWREEMP